MNLKEKLEAILGFKNDIKNSLINKGSDIDDSTPLSGYAEKIDNLTTGGGDSEVKLWTPDTEWWDILNIIRNDVNTGDYAYLNDYGKMIFLIDDSQDELNIPLMPNSFSDYGRWHAVKTSDGHLYTPSSSTRENIIHTWDKSKDKPSSNPEVKTRYLIYYLNPSNRNCEFPQHVYNMGIGSSMIYTIWAINMTTNDSGHWSYSVCPKLQAFEMLEGYELIDSRVPFEFKLYPDNDYSVNPFTRGIKFIRYYGSTGTNAAYLLSGLRSQLINYALTGSYLLISTTVTANDKQFNNAFTWYAILNRDEILNNLIASESKTDS